MNFDQVAGKDYWVWDDETNCLKIHREGPIIIKAVRRRLSSIAFEKLMAKKGHRYAHVMALRIKFNESTDLMKMEHFRLLYRRPAPRPPLPDVVTLRDIKDVVLFQAGELPDHFLDFFNTVPVDNLMRVLILYFYFFLQGYGKIQKYYQNVKTYPKMEHIMNTSLQTILRDLGDLKTLVAREYASLIIERKDMQHFHHFFCHKGGPNKIFQPTRSFSLRDQWLYECLYQMLTRVVWIANERHSLSLIEIEINHLFRGMCYNIIKHNVKNVSQRSQHSNLRASENQLKEATIFFMYEYGSPLVTKTRKEETKTICHWENSPLIEKLLYDNNIDLNLLDAGIEKVPEGAERLAFFEKAIITPEEDLTAKNMFIGILGRKRNEFNMMLEELGDEDEGDSKTKSVSKKPQYTKRQTIAMFKIPPGKK